MGKGPLEGNVLNRQIIIIVGDIGSVHWKEIINPLFLPIWEENVKK